ncbi:MAG: DEAD/DEAH box helicase [Bdellovibrionota bacterium]|nr:MAG: DEAD/DEAH box helicase [Bdellovibrionota bacterium]
MSAFGSAFQFPPNLVAAISSYGFVAPRPVQEAAIPLLDAGKDVVALAQTGSGKTAAYLLPIIRRLIDQANGGEAQAPYALVVFPVRELCVQVAAELQKLTPPEFNIRVLPLYGGMRRKTGLVDGQPPHVVLATPAKLVDFQMRGLVDTSHIKMLVLDEFDRVLEHDSFQSSLQAMLRRGYIPPVGERVTALFSATMSPRLRTVLPEWVRDFTELRVDDRKPVVEIAHRAVRLVGEGGVPVLRRLLAERNGASGRTLVFCNTNDRAEELGHRLRVLGFPCATVTGKIPQPERLARLRQLRSGEVPLVVCSDVFGRGMDIDGLDLVVNYDFPKTADNYKHRVGRTGRAGRSGEAVSLLRPSDVDNFIRFTSALKVDFQLYTPPDLSIPSDPFQQAALVTSLGRTIIAFRHEYVVCPPGGKVDALVSLIGELASTKQLRVFLKNRTSLEALATSLRENGIGFKQLSPHSGERDLADGIHSFHQAQPGLWLISDEFITTSDLAQHIVPTADAVVIGYDLAGSTRLYLGRLGGYDHLRQAGLCVHLVHENERYALSMLRKSVGVQLEERAGRTIA